MIEIDDVAGDLFAALTAADVPPTDWPRSVRSRAARVRRRRRLVAAVGVLPTAGIAALVCVVAVSAGTSAPQHELPAYAGAPSGPVIRVSDSTPTPAVHYTVTGAAVPLPGDDALSVKPARAGTAKAFCAVDAGFPDTCDLLPVVGPEEIRLDANIGGVGWTGAGVLDNYVWAATAGSAITHVSVTDAGGKTVGAADLSTVRAAVGIGVFGFSLAGTPGPWTVVGTDAAGKAVAHSTLAIPVEPLPPLGTPGNTRKPDTTVDLSADLSVAVYRAGNRFELIPRTGPKSSAFGGTFTAPTSPTDLTTQTPRLSSGTDDGKAADAYTVLSGLAGKGVTKVTVVTETGTTLDVAPVSISPECDCAVYAFRIAGQHTKITVHAYDAAGTETSRWVLNDGNSPRIGSAPTPQD